MEFKTKQLILHQQIPPPPHTHTHTQQPKSFSTQDNTTQRNTIHHTTLHHRTPLPKFHNTDSSHYPVLAVHAQKTILSSLPPPPPIPSHAPSIAPLHGMYLHCMAKCPCIYSCRCSWRRLPRKPLHPEGVCRRERKRHSAHQIKSFLSSRLNKQHTLHWYCTRHRPLHSRTHHSYFGDPSVLLDQQATL